MLLYRFYVTGIKVINTVTSGIDLNEIPGRMVMKMFENS